MYHFSINNGDSVDFSITLRKPTKFCNYFIIARGNIIKSELINVEEHTQPIKRSLEITFEYVPRAFILAYYVHEGILYFDELGFNINKNFENEVSVKVQKKITF